MGLEYNLIKKMKEDWEDIIGYEGFYQVSKTGKIKSVQRFIEKSNGCKLFVAEKILRPNFNTAYPTVVLHKHGKQKCCPVHRLVAGAFLKNPKNKPQVNHLDGVKSNFHVDNLEWCTRSENVSHAYNTGLNPNRGETAVGAKLTKKEVIMIRLLYRLDNYSCRILADEFNVSAGTICNIGNKKQWKHV